MVDATTANGNTGSEPPKLNWNTLFRGDRELGAYNACVGNNGCPDLYYYAEGFADSVFLLIDALITGQCSMLDTLIYPICFNLRHSVELTLKGQIQDLSWLAKLRKHPLAPDTDIEKVLNQHDIMNLWNFFSGHAVTFDQRYNANISALTPLIDCIGQTDPTGQTFRYSYSTEAKKHLTDVSVINVLVLRDQFRIIRNYLEELKELSEWLSKEYSTGTFTKNLSRNDLQVIAGKLPLRQSWPQQSAGLPGIKKSIKAEYNIGSKELSEAFNKIQNCRDLARIIGMTVHIPGLSLTDLITLNNCWKLAWDRDALLEELRNDISGANASTVEPVNLKQALEHELQMMKDTRSSLDQFRQWATENRLAGLQALFEARSFLFCEEYDLHYEYYKKDVVMAFSASSQSRDEEIEAAWSRSIGRPNFPSRLINILKFAGFNHEAIELEKNIFS